MNKVPHAIVDYRHCQQLWVHSTGYSHHCLCFFLLAAKHFPNCFNKCVDGSTINDALKQASLRLLAVEG